MLYLSSLINAHLTELLMLGVVILSSIWLWLKYNFSYWKRHNVPFIKPNWLFGNIKDIVMQVQNPGEHLQLIYTDKVAVDQPAVGIFLFNKPCLLVRDPELAKLVLIKDFNKFSNRHSASDPHSDPLGGLNLFFVKNPVWKEIRTKLTPVFTSGKMKQMFPLIEEIGGELDNYLRSLPTDPKTKAIELELKGLNSLYSTDVIATIAYGVRANSIQNPNSDFCTNGRRIFYFTVFRAFEFTAMFFWPGLVYLFGFKFFSKKTSDFLRSAMNHIIDERIKSGITRNDLIDVLVTFKQSAEKEPGDSKEFQLKGDALVAQAAVFFSAGFETTSGTMSFALYELSKRLDLQQRLRNEIREYLEKNNGKATYEMVNEMPYLNMVVLEVLRMYPPLPFLDRECTLNQGEKGYSLKPYCNFTVPYNMPVFIPIYAMQRDPKYFPNPDEFDPERFSPANRKNINNLAYMPFGAGPHNCIGERFGTLSAKAGLTSFLRNHYVTPCEKSHAKMTLDPRALIIQSEGGLYCNVVRDPLL